MFNILPLLPPLAPLRIIDVGAMSLGGGDPYRRLARAAPVEVVGFEPVAEELAKLRAANHPNRTYLPFVVGDGDRHTFHECNYAMTSSIFAPNRALVDKFQGLGDYMQVVKTTEVDTVRLDDIAECTGADFIKVDVQGAELMILKGAERLLASVQVVEAEVEFVELYSGQPLFADVDAYMRAQGFRLHKFTPIAGRAFKPIFAGGDPNADLSQILWTDAIYVRDFMRFAEMPSEQLLKLAVILHENYQSIDLAALALAAADQREGTTLQASYLAKLTGK